MNVGYVHKKKLCEEIDLNIDRSAINDSVEFWEFFFKEGNYCEKIEILDLEYLILKAKVEISEKYNIKKKYTKKSQEVTPIDIDKEFIKLFKNPKVSGEFITLLMKREYITEEEKWKGISKRPGELREAYHALEELNLLKPGLHSLNSKKIFYKRFGLVPEEPGIKKYFISRKSLGDKNTTKDYDAFIKILEPLTHIL